MIVIMFSFKTDLFSQNIIRGRRKQKVNIGLLKQNFRTRGELRTHLFQSPHQRQEEALFTLMLYTNLFIIRTSSPTKSVLAQDWDGFIWFHLFFKERGWAGRGFSCTCSSWWQASGQVRGVLGGSGVRKLEIWGLALLKADEKQNKLCVLSVKGQESSPFHLPGFQPPLHIPFIQTS